MRGRKRRLFPPTFPLALQSPPTCRNKILDGTPNAASIEDPPSISWTLVKIGPSSLTGLLIALDGDNAEEEPFAW